jgi:hypothetical protein
MKRSSGVNGKFGEEDCQRQVSENCAATVVERLQSRYNDCMSDNGFLRTALRPEIMKRSAFTALVVGSILAGINHGAELIRLEVDWNRLLRIALTYTVPFCVATYSATMQELRHRG